MEADKKLVLALIKDDLINTCLVSALVDIVGIEAGDYYLHLSETIFDLMGYKNDFKSEEIQEEYYKLTRKVKPTYVKEGKEKLDEMAEEIYGFLLSNKPK